MATYNETYSLPSQQVPLNPISIVDIFFPGLTNISAAFLQLQTGNTNGYAQILCICGIVVFLGKYPYNFVKEFVDSHFSSWLLRSGDTFLTVNSFNGPRLPFR
jgi:mitochondrial chaperone BCS1